MELRIEQKRIVQFTTDEAKSLLYGLTIKFPELWPSCDQKKPQFEVEKHFAISLVPYSHFIDEAIKTQIV